MSQTRRLLCTDLDRTIIPNGSHPEHPAARDHFRALCRLPEVTVVYVTGRDRRLVEAAIADYALPVPDFAITDVGSEICAIAAGAWQPLPGWHAEIAPDWRGRSREEIARLLAGIGELRLQEAEKQNTFKLSYYLPLEVDSTAVIAAAEAVLQTHGVAASLIWSIDEPNEIGLLDILPRSADKLHGIRFLCRQLQVETEAVLFAGDSGNDLQVLGSDIPSILVANASDAVRDQARQLARAKGYAERLYLAREEGFFLGGNYSAGVLQGVCHFFPDLGRRLHFGEAPR